MVVVINENDASHRFASLVYKLFTLFLVVVVQQNTGAEFCVQQFAFVAGAGVTVLPISGSVSVKQKN
jgi:hypothetical protein